MHRHAVATTINGKEVYAVLIRTPLKERISRNPHLLTLVKEVVASADLTEPTVVIERDMERSIGYPDLVAIREKDTIFYARQVKAEAYTKFVKNRRTDPSSYITIRLQEDELGDYEVVDVWVGRNYPPAPGEEGENGQSKAYWEDHAVAYNGQAIIASTVTKECPY